MKRHSMWSHQHHKLTKKYFFDCFCHHYSNFWATNPVLKLQRHLQPPVAGGQYLLQLLDALLNSQWIVTNTVVSTPTSPFLKSRVEILSPWTFALTLFLTGKESWASKSGKALQGKPLGSFSDMEGELPFHDCSLRCFSRYKQDSSNFKLSPRTDNNTLAVLFLQSNDAHTPLPYWFKIRLILKDTIIIFL